MEAGMATKATVESRVVHQVWLGIWFALAAYVTFQTVQQHFCLGFTKTVAVETRRISKDEGSYYWKMPHRYRSTLMNSRLQLTENGKPFSRVDRINSLVERGEGWFMVANNNLRFIPNGGGDPRSNGKRYLAVLPMQYEGMELWVPWAALLAVSFMVARRGPARKLPTISFRYELAVVFLISCAVTAWRVHDLGVYSDGAFTICGEPQSDAAGWFMLGQGIAEGWGMTGAFSGQRPIYSALIAPLYFLPGNPLSWFLGLNVVLLGVATAAAYCLATLLLGRTLAVVSAAAIVFGDDHLVHIMNVSTETAGLALSLVSVVAVAHALQQGRHWFCLIGGLLVGLANLASGATILAIPALAVLVLVAAWMKRGLKFSIGSAALFTVGVSMVFLPWMIRQKVVLGTFSPSLNSGSLLRSGADPTIDWADVHHDPQLTGGIAPDDYGGANEHHMKHFKRIVASDPVGYAQRVLAQWKDCFVYFRVFDPGHRAAGLLLLLILALVAVIQRRNVAGLLVAGALGAAWASLEREQTLGLAVVSYGILFWQHRKSEQRWLIPLILLHLLAATFLVGGMAANQTITRTWQVVGWALQLPALAALGIVWTWLSTALEKRQPWCRDLGVAEAANPVRGDTTLVMACSSYCLVAIALSLSAVLQGPDKTTSVTLHPTALENAKMHVAQNHPLGAIASTLLDVQAVRLSYRQHYQPAGHDPAGWLSHTAKADYDRWFYSLERADVVAPPDRRAYGQGQTRIAPKGIRPDQPVLWISQRQTHRNSIDGSSYSVHNGLALIPITEGQPNLAATQWLQPCPEPQ